MSSADDSPAEGALAEFPQVAYAEWRKRVADELAGAPFDDALVYSARDGLERQPLYAREHLPEGAEQAALPGVAPYLRGTKPGPGPWQIGLEIDDARPEDAARAMRAACEQGATLLWLRLDPAAGIRAAGDGTFDTLAAAAEPGTAVVLDARAAALDAARSWVAAIRRLGGDPSELAGSFACDPLGILARSGGTADDLDAGCRQMAELAAWAGSEAPGMKSVLVGAADYRDAGATASDELAFAVATGTAYLRRLTAAGLDLDAAARQIELLFSTGRDLFEEIARLRAARLLWSKVVAAWGGGEAAARVRVVARTSTLETSRLDPWMNLVRAGAQAWAAALGGADAIVVAPHDALLAAPGAAGRRLAVHLQHILADEARLDRVADPAGGSFYLESLTDALARAAWERFRDLERRGGMERCVIEGHVAESLRASAGELRLAAATRREAVIGASAFVDPFEDLAEEGAAEPAAGGEPEARPPAAIEPLRLAEPFEALRRRAEGWRRVHGRRPRAQLVELAKSGRDTAFVRRLLAVGGIEGAEAGGPEAALATAEATEVVVLLGAADADAGRLAELVPRFRERGARSVLAAGPPGAAAALEAHGVSGVVHDGCDVVALLDAVLREVGAG